MQQGNIFVTLFAAIGLVALIGATAMTVMRGPVTSMSHVTDQTIVKNDLVAATSMISEKSLAAAMADCDADGLIEPEAYASGATNVPAGGGVLPANMGINRNDPWGRAYGYCVWDQGLWTRTDDIAACGGIGAARLNGAENGAGIAIAVMSAGKNGFFETGCYEWVDHDSDGNPDVLPVITQSGSDDIVRVVPYGQFLMPSSAQAKLDPMPDASCTTATAGIMRIMLGVVQVCDENQGWVEIAPAAGGDIYFTPVTNAMLNSEHISNSVTFGSLSESLPVTINGGATLSINGGMAVTSGTVSTGDTLTLGGTAAAQPEITKQFVINIGPITKTWSITTRDAYIGQLTIAPLSITAMNVTGPGNPAYGATVGFIVTNIGERPVGPLASAVLSNTTRFSFNSSGGYIGDNCAGKTLQGTLGGGAQTCVLDVRPKATADGTYSSTLSVTDGLSSVTANLSGTATGWDCPLPWGGKLVNGNSVVAYTSSCALLSCTSQTRTCTNGVLSGSYQHASCNVLLSC